MTQFAYLIPLFPFVAFVANILFGKKLGHRTAHLSIFTSLAACAVALPCAYEVVGSHESITASVEWLKLENYSLSFGYLLDPLSATLLFFVSIIGTLIQVYSVGYMHGDKHYSRFFAYMSLFMAAMLALTIANNFVLFFMAWEIMGLCSYLLIGFWYEKKSAADAGRKAFLTTRVGDVGFLLGILTLFLAGGTLDFMDLERVALQGHALLPLAALLIFCGTIGKSAQFPLHVWLPDAMEGPTPVSALIHAATMVAAGVYLVARTFVLFSDSASAMLIVTMIGTLTAFMAAFFALTQTDIKRVLAYSTISQLGYCIAAMGLGTQIAGTFHLMTHAFFKALLFLGAGSVIHGCGTQDMRQMGGLLGKMKHTGLTFIIAAAAIAGLPPLSGFWSKDEILLAAFSENTTIFWILALTSLMTAFYMFRAVFMTFFGQPRDPKVRAHESPKSMTIPLWILAVGAVFVGLPGSPWMHNWYQRFLEGPHGHGTHELNLFVAAVSVFAAVAGIGLAYLMYYKKNGWAEAISAKFKPLYNASVNKLWFDELYGTIVIRPFLAVGNFLFGFDQKVVDRMVNETGVKTVKTASVKNWIDQYIVDGLVNLTGYVTLFFSAFLRRLQTGFIQHYLLILVLGVLAMMFFELKS